MAHSVKKHVSQCRRRGAKAFRILIFGVAALIANSFAIAQVGPRQSKADACEGYNGGVTLASGFCATIFADNLGHARQMAFAPNGVLYVNTWSGRYYQNDKPPAGGFLLALRDSKGTGRADID